MLHRQQVSTKYLHGRMLINSREDGHAPFTQELSRWAGCYRVYVVETLMQDGGRGEQKVTVEERMLHIDDSMFEHKVDCPRREGDTDTVSFVMTPLKLD